MEHGGDLAEAARRTGIERDDWLDLSTGINPEPFAPGDMPAAYLARLPDRTALRALEDTARAAYAAASGAHVTAAPGTQALIQLLPRLRQPGTVAVAGPTYGEHAIAWQAAGHRVTETGEPEAGAADVVIVVNPNNPDGVRREPDRLLELAHRLARRGGLLVADEAFADAHREVSLAPHAGEPGLVVLRSFGKFYGLAGLRLGFALTAPALGARLNAMLGPWAVSGPAIWAGRRALADECWAAATRSRLARDAEALDAVLISHGLRVVGGTALFRLAEHRQAHGLHDALARQGVWTRKFTYAPTWLRFGLPGGTAGLDRLDAALGPAREATEATDIHAAAG